MNNLKTLFVRWYFNEFTDSELFTNMAAVSENSAWHREQNVAVHTNMVVGEYLTRAITIAKSGHVRPWHMKDIYGAFACAFHDVGKPAARKEVSHPVRGTYYRYGGHELISARLWEDWAVANWQMLSKDFNFHTSSIYRIGWLIENHLPWAIKNTTKRKMLAGGVADAADLDTFVNIVKADSYGRISDDADEKRATVEQWCSDFKALYYEVENDKKHEYINHDAPVLFLPIAASGSGKSTLLTSECMQEMREYHEIETLQHYSFDVLRHEWYDPEDYANAWELANADPTFKNRAFSVFAEMVKKYESIYVDNVNLTKKSRGQFVKMAKNAGYTVVAILIPIEVDTIVQRQITRTDKGVPEYAVRRQYMSVNMPSLGEVDQVMVYSVNLPKE